MTGVAAQYLWPGFEDLKLKEPLRTSHTACLGDAENLLGRGVGGEGGGGGKIAFGRPGSGQPTLGASRMRL